MKKLRSTMKKFLLLIVAGLIACAGENNTPSLIYTIEEKPSGYKEADRLGQWFPASDFEAVGIYLPPGQPINVSVKNLKGNSQPKLLVGTYSRYKAGDVKYHVLSGCSIDKQKEPWSL